MEVWTLVFAALAAIIPVVLWRWDHLQRNRSPHVEILLNRESTDGLPPCLDWVSHGLHEKVCFITVRNRRTVPMTITEAFVHSTSRPQPFYLQPTNVPRALPPGLCVRYELKMADVSDPLKAALVLKSGTWNRTYPLA